MPARILAGAHLRLVMHGLREEWGACFLESPMPDHELMDVLGQRSQSRAGVPRFVEWVLRKPVEGSVHERSLGAPHVRSLRE